MTVQHRTHTTIVHAKNHKELALLQEENGRLREELAAAEGRVTHLEDSRFALAVAHTEDSLTIERLEGRVAELEAECNQLGQGQILLADEVAELEAENARLKAVEQKIQFFCSAEGHSPCLALLATYATAKEQK